MAEKTYELIDCEGLATLLAKDAWEEELKAKGVTEDQMYESVTDPAQRVKYIRAEWLPNFNELRKTFLELIIAFKKP